MAEMTSVLFQKKTITKMDLTTILLTLLIGYIIYSKFGPQIQAFFQSNIIAQRPSYFSDEYKSVKEVSEALRKADVESCNLIIGIDFTSSNLHQGRRTFLGKSLHAITPSLLNPYQQVITIIGKTLEHLDEDKMIPTFGFGDLSTKDHSVFPFVSSHSLFCNGVEEVLALYNHIVPTIQLSGPTSFVPLIDKAIDIVCQKRVMEYHILLIIADGQVSNEKENMEAIVRASEYPLSIVMIGVGDGPWELMEKFDDALPERKFDNFQFVEYSKVIEQARRKFDKIGNEDEMKNLIEAEFSLAALMEIPLQYKACKELNLIGKRVSDITPH